MAYNEKTYSLLKMIYRNVLHIVNNYYYISNGLDLIDKSYNNIEIWRTDEGYILNMDANSKISVSYLFLKIFDNYKIVLVRTNMREEHYIYDTLTEKILKGEIVNNNKDLIQFVVDNYSE